MHRNNKDDSGRSPPRLTYHHSTPSDALSPSHHNRRTPSPRALGVTAAIPCAPSVETRRLSSSSSRSQPQSQFSQSDLFVLPVSASDMLRRLPDGLDPNEFHRSDHSAFQHPSISSHHQQPVRAHPPFQHQLSAPTLGPSLASATRKLCETRRPSPVFSPLSPHQPTRAFHFTGHSSLAFHSPNSSAVTHSDSLSPVDSSLLPPSHKSSSMPSTPLISAYRPTSSVGPYSSISADTSPGPVRKNLTPPIPQRRGEYPSPRSMPQSYRSLAPDISMVIPVEAKAASNHQSPHRTCRQDVPVHPSDASSPSPSVLGTEAHGPVASSARMDAFFNSVSSELSPRTVHNMEDEDWRSLLSTYRKTPR